MFFGGYFTPGYWAQNYWQGAGIMPTPPPPLTGGMQFAISPTEQGGSAAIFAEGWNNLRAGLP